MPAAPTCVSYWFRVGDGVPQGTLIRHTPSMQRRTVGRPLPSLATIRLDLSPHHDTGLAVQRSELIPSNAFRRGRNDQLHPDSVRSLVKRGLGRLAQGVEARLLLPGSRVGETR